MEHTHQFRNSTTCEWTTYLLKNKKGTIDTLSVAATSNFMTWSAVLRSETATNKQPLRSQPCDMFVIQMGGFCNNAC